MKFGSVPINWFDLVLIGTLVAGVIQGRRRGMSAELLDVLQWLMIVVVAALYYQPVGRAIAQFSQLSLVFSYICAYVFLAIVIKSAFAWLRTSVGEKLVGSDVFGNGEYVLGMGAGAVRCLCILLAILAVLNARYVPPDKQAANARMQQDNFGSISFPTLASIQNDVFKGSLSGRFIRSHLGDQLIAQTAVDASLGQGDTLRARRNRELEEVFGSQ